MVQAQVANGPGSCRGKRNQVVPAGDATVTRALNIDVNVCVRQSEAGIPFAHHMMRFLFSGMQLKQGGTAGIKHARP